MKESKRRFETFNLYDYQGVEAHLSRMAAEGWRLERTGVWFWTYRRAEPARVRYAVTYSQNLSQFDPVPTEGQEVLEDLCEAAGWKSVCGWNQMQIFATEDEHPVPLETDEALRLEVIHRTMKKHYFPANLILLALGLLMSASAISSAVRTPLRFFGSNGRMFSALMYLIMVLLLLFNLGTYLLWRRRSERSVAAGGTCVPMGAGYRRTAAASLAVVLLLMAGYAVLESVTMQAGYGLFFMAYMALFFLLMIVVHGTKNALKRRGVSRGKNMAVTLAVDLLLAFALVGGLTFAAFRFNWFGSGQGDSYTYQREPWDASPVSIPLTNADVTGETFDHVRRYVYARGSFLLPVRTFRETALREGDGLRRILRYTIQEPKMQWLYDAVLEDELEDRTEDVLGEGTWIRTIAWREEDPSPWGAEAVWRQYRDGEAADVWLLCWPGRAVEVELDLEEAPSPEEMARIGQGLRTA